MFNPYPANVDKMAASTTASKWRMGFNSAFKVLIRPMFRLIVTSRACGSVYVVTYTWKITKRLCANCFHFH